MAVASAIGKSESAVKPQNIAPAPAIEADDVLADARGVEHGRELAAIR